MTEPCPCGCALCGEVQCPSCHPAAPTPASGDAASIRAAWIAAGGRGDAWAVAATARAERDAARAEADGLRRQVKALCDEAAFDTHSGSPVVLVSDLRAALADRSDPGA